MAEAEAEGAAPSAVMAEAEVQQSPPLRDDAREQDREVQHNASLRDDAREQDREDEDRAALRRFDAQEQDRGEQDREAQQNASPRDDTREQDLREHYDEVFGEPDSHEYSIDSFESSPPMPAISIEELLNDTTIIDDFKRSDEALLERLCSEQAVQEMCELLVEPPPPGTSDVQCHRQLRASFTVGELLTCGCASGELCDAFIYTRSPGPLEKLWDFVIVSSTDVASSAFADYFAKVARSLYARSPQEVAQRLLRHAADDLLEGFLERLSSETLTELLLDMLCAKRPSELIVPTDRIVELLLARLVQRGVEENASRIVKGLLHDTSTLCFEFDFFKQLVAPNVIDFLVELVLRDQPGCSYAAASILTCIFSHPYMVTSADERVMESLHSSLREGDDSPHSSVTHSPPSSPQSPDVDSLTTEATESRPKASVSSGGGDDDPAVARTPRRRPTETMATTPRQLAVYAINRICHHLPELAEFIGGDSGRIAVTPGGKFPAAGRARLEIVKLLTVLIKTGRSSVLKAVRESQALPRCLVSFFRHPFNCVLHNAVSDLISEALVAGASTAAEGLNLVIAFLRDGEVSKCFLTEYLRDEERQNAGPRNKLERVGYMAHLHLLTVRLSDFCTCVPQCAGLLVKADGWLSLVLPGARAALEIYSMELGPAAPPSPPASVQVPAPADELDDAFEAVLDDEPAPEPADSDADAAAEIQDGLGAMHSVTSENLSGYDEAVEVDAEAEAEWDVNADEDVAEETAAHICMECTETAPESSQDSPDDSQEMDAMHQTSESSPKTLDNEQYEAPTLKVGDRLRAREGKSHDGYFKAPEHDFGMRDPRGSACYTEDGEDLEKELLSSLPDAVEVGDDPCHTSDRVEADEALKIHRPESAPENLNVEDQGADEEAEQDNNCAVETRIARRDVVEQDEKCESNVVDRRNESKLLVSGPEPGLIKQVERPAAFTNTRSEAPPCQLHPVMGGC